MAARFKTPIEVYHDISGADHVTVFLLALAVVEMTRLGLAGTIPEAMLWLIIAASQLRVAELESEDNT